MRIFQDACCIEHCVFGSLAKIFVPQITTQEVSRRHPILALHPVVTVVPSQLMAVVNHLQLSMTRQSQIIDEMSQRICEPDSADNVRRIDAILEKLQNLEEIVMKTR